MMHWPHSTPSLLMVLAAEDDNGIDNFQAVAVFMKQRYLPEGSVTIIYVFYNNINRFASAPLTASGTQGAISFFKFFSRRLFPGLTTENFKAICVFLSEEGKNETLNTYPSSF